MKNWDIIVKYLNNEATAAEKQELEAWLKKDMANAALYEEIKLSWEKSGEALPDDDFDVAAGWESVQEKIKQKDNIIPITGRNSSLKWVLRIAAVLVISLSSLWYYNNSDQTVTQLYVSTTNEPRLITLPDGSTIWLNKNSEIWYPEKFDKDERFIQLEGEAFFDVVRNPAQPFKVQNKDFEVRVLGTSFNVLAYKNSKQVVVTVESGTVALTNIHFETLTLTKGEVGSINRSNNHILQTVNADLNFMAWKTRKLSFNNQSIKQVCDALKKHFSIDVIVEDKTIYNCKFTGSFDDAKLQDVLKTMEAALNIKVKTNQNRVTISGKGCE
ncbi:MAG: FecR domain-containing protein [Bacteroidota bacterium]|nr:FecR domain-containing protein [Bacteroidota bacterium]